MTSKARHVKVKIEGIPVTGIIDTGSDITIINGKLFKNVVDAAQLSSEAFKPANKQACAYSGQPIALDGQMDVTISFESHDIRTTIYVKLQAPDQLLLSESVCRELSIVKYHSLVHSVESEVMEGSGLRQENSNNKSENTIAKVKMIRTVRIPANHAAVVPIQVVDKTDEIDETGLLLLEPNPVLGEALSIDNFLVQLHNGESTAITISKYSTTTHILNEGDEIGTVSRVNVVDSYATDPDLPDHSVMENINDYSLIDAEVPSNSKCDDYSHEKSEWRKEQLVRLCGSNPLLSPDESSKLNKVLCAYHDIFSLEEGERGETDLVEFAIDTGDSIPSKQPARRVPYAARREIAMQLENMQNAGVIQESQSPWASPVVLVRKRDGTLRFCVDYRNLNSVTKAGVFPLPRIDDLLDKLGAAKYFTTLDLAAGYWQIKMEKCSQEKTAFITHQGLYEFNVMPFGVINAPAVFQRLMQRVLMNLKASEEFVSVYLDDIIIFSKTLQDHLNHLEVVFCSLRKANLKLKPTKCNLYLQRLNI